ncbi:hypothetical protein [Mycoplasmopsis arginini]|uniref:Lipoprotein n=1 Tax=Mycoplasmopsis arginini TaxID=2094 RepID=A0AA43QXB3_MYCAR|nr:hypothetical protein [Mycoplasmopsis arginini]MCY2902898.1 variable surface lipoprotein [Mycoplasmopsis arginini QMP CG1-2758]MDI3349049.1 hypothetical protein [Mycoplasmopsis arginini]MDI3349895.1 hypothetical protein [Mycoplasmopsis arginini]MDI3350240.1 hypothetical protein [Mycoplasmopsis arginini]MDI3350875.1 hypothetical protein [Mycoplasmopsis arginini]
MSKKKLLLPILATTTISILPIVAISCENGNSGTSNKPKVQLLTSSQIQEIVDKFEFKLTKKGSDLETENKLNELWEKLVRNKDNTKSNSQIIINWNSEFKDNFIFNFHKLNGFGSSHKYTFKLIWDNQTPAISYQILCVDRNNELEYQGMVKLEIQ